MDAALAGKFQLLRTRIEADLPLPAVVLVTSASRGDGKSVTASGLATCFAEAGRRVAFVDGQPRMAARAPGTIQSGVTLLPLPLDAQCTNVSSQAMAHFVEQMRGMYDCTIIDGVAFAQNNSPVVLAGIVDGVLLTVRLGRVPCREDRLMSEMLEHTKAPLLGVVAVSPDAIDGFNAPRPIEDRRPALDSIDRTTLSPTPAAR
jgi:Mrp family chromosome partitioning ATPase